MYPLHLGYYGVKCRSQRQIEENMSIKQALENERKFFQEHPIYSSYVDHLGIRFLADSMSKILR